MLSSADAASRRSSGGSVRAATAIVIKAEASAHEYDNKDRQPETEKQSVHSPTSPAIPAMPVPAPSEVDLLTKSHHQQHLLSKLKHQQHALAMSAASSSPLTTTAAAAAPAIAAATTTTTTNRHTIRLHSSAASAAIPPVRVEPVIAATPQSHVVRPYFHSATSAVQPPSAAPRSAPTHETNGKVKAKDDDFNGDFSAEDATDDTSAGEDDILDGCEPRTDLDDDEDDEDDAQSRIVEADGLILLEAGIVPETEVDFLLSHVDESESTVAAAAVDSDSERRAEHADEQKYDKFIRWMTQHGAVFPNLVLKRYAKDYRGVHIRSTAATTATEEKEQTGATATVPTGLSAAPHTLPSPTPPSPAQPAQPTDDLPIPRGSILLSIPHHLLITVELAKASPLGSLIQHLQSLGSQAILSVYLIQEKFKQRMHDQHVQRTAAQRQKQMQQCKRSSSPHSTHTTHEQEEKSAVPAADSMPQPPSAASLTALEATPASPPEASFWQPWLDVLPSSFSTLPMFFGEEEAALLVGCTELLVKVASQQKSMREEFTTIKSLLKAEYVAWVRASSRAAETGSSPPAEVIPFFHEFLRSFTYRAFVWGCLAVGTRVFSLQIQNAKTSVLAPLADMMNHKNPAGTNWTYDSKRASFTLTSCTELACGDAVYESYGIKDNKRFLASYGFCLEDNAANEVAIQIAEFGSDQLAADAAPTFAYTSSDASSLAPPPPPHRSFTIRGAYDHLAEEVLNFLRIANCYEEQIEAEEAELEAEAEAQAEAEENERQRRALMVAQHHASELADVDADDADADPNHSSEPSCHAEVSEAEFHSLLQQRIYADSYSQHQRAASLYRMSVHPSFAAQAYASLRSGPSPFVSSGPISLDNELSALYSLRQSCRHGIRAYSCSLEDDARLLAALPEVSSSMAVVNRRNALVFRMGEKKILHYWIDFATLAIALMCAPWERLATTAGGGRRATCKSKVRHMLETGSIDGILSPFVPACDTDDEKSRAHATEEKQEVDASASSSNFGSRPATRSADSLYEDDEDAFTSSLSCPASLSLLLQDLATTNGPTRNLDAASGGAPSAGIACYVTSVVVPLQQQRHRTMLKRKRKKQLQMAQMREYQHALAQRQHSTQGVSLALQSDFDFQQHAYDHAGRVLSFRDEDDATAYQRVYGMHPSQPEDDEDEDEDDEDDLVRRAHELHLDGSAHPHSLHFSEAELYHYYRRRGLDPDEDDDEEEDPALDDDESEVDDDLDAEEEEDNDLDYDLDDDDLPSSRRIHRLNYLADGVDDEPIGVDTTTRAPSASQTRPSESASHTRTDASRLTMRPSSGTSGVRARSDSAVGVGVVTGGAVNSSSRSASRSASRVAFLQQYADAQSAQRDRLRSAGTAGGVTSRASLHSSASQHEDSIMRDSDDDANPLDDETEEQMPPHTAIALVRAKSFGKGTSGESSAPIPAKQTTDKASTTQKTTIAVGAATAGGKQRPPPLTVYHDASTSNVAASRASTTASSTATTRPVRLQPSSSSSSRTPSLTSASTPSPVSSGVGQSKSGHRKKILHAAESHKLVVTKPTASTATTRTTTTAASTTPTVEAAPLPRRASSHSTTGTHSHASVSVRSPSSHVSSVSVGGAPVPLSLSGSFSLAPSSSHSSLASSRAALQQSHTPHVHVHILHRASNTNAAAQLTPSPPPPPHASLAVSPSRVLPAVSPRNSPARTRVASASAASSPSRIAIGSTTTSATTPTRLPLVLSPSNSMAASSHAHGPSAPVVSHSFTALPNLSPSKSTSSPHQRSVSRETKFEHAHHASAAYQPYQLPNGSYLSSSSGAHRPTSNTATRAGLTPSHDITAHDADRSPTQRRPSHPPAAPSASVKSVAPGTIILRRSSPPVVPATLPAHSVSLHSSSTSSNTRKSDRCAVPMHIHSTSVQMSALHQAATTATHTITVAAS